MLKFPTTNDLMAFLKDAEEYFRKQSRLPAETMNYKIAYSDAAKAMKQLRLLQEGRMIPHKNSTK